MANQTANHGAIELPCVIAEHITAVNAFDTDAIVATFDDDAYVNDYRREVVGIDAIGCQVAPAQRKVPLA